MPDREKVIRGLGACLAAEVTEDENPCASCPYFFDEMCQSAIKKDALALLREQEPVIVRCKDCKFWHDPIRCRLDSEGLKTSDEWFCADGKRR